jgi:NAD-dependent deacetylase
MSDLPPPRIVVLTGAGISAESGISTFRGSDGLWEGHDIRQVATPEGFRDDPDLVQRFYNLRRASLATVEPNEAHRALARLQREYPGDVFLITQNVDDLHERAGSPEDSVWHMHGELKKARCLECDGVCPWDGDITSASVCPACRSTGRLRPHIVWFGEMPLQVDSLFDAVGKAGLFLAIGTSGKVYPAAGFVDLACKAGAATWEINLDETDASERFMAHRIGPATVEVPRWVEEVLSIWKRGK